MEVVIVDDAGSEVLPVDDILVALEDDKEVKETPLIKVIMTLIKTIFYFLLILCVAQV